MIREKLIEKVNKFVDKNQFLCAESVVDMLLQEIKKNEDKKPDPYMMLNIDGHLIATGDSREDLEELKKGMLDSGKFTKYRVKGMVITKNEVKFVGMD